MKLLFAASSLLTLACASVPDDPQPVGGPGTCTAEGLEALLGREASQELGAEALRRSGARALRWIRPGDMVTMDYREDRLNAHLDSNGRVERFACG